MTVVYFIRAGDQGPVKIGYGRNVYRRRDMLQGGCPDPLIILGVMAGGLKEERALHHRFAHLQTRGEWFTWSEEIAAFVAENCAAPLPTLRRNRHLNSASEIIDKLGGNAAVAAMCDVGASAISNWRALGAFPPRVHLIIFDECQKAGLDVPTSYFRAMFDRQLGRETDGGGAA
jgi:hypothetical protein